MPSRRVSAARENVLIKIIVHYDDPSQSMFEIIVVLFPPESLQTCLGGSMRMVCYRIRGSG